MNRPALPDARALFGHVYDRPAAAQGTARARADILGGHTDYNQGYVLTVPLGLGVAVAVAPCPDPGPDRIRLEGYSERRDDLRRRDVPRLADEAPEARRGDWLDYALGVVRAAQHLGAPVGSLRIAVRGTVPIGAGLASSAVLTVALLRALADAYDCPALLDDAAVTAQKVEHDHAGVDCGLMDPLAILHGVPGAALFLDTDTLARRTLPLAPDWRLAIVDSGERRSLADAGYNLRREECALAARLLGVRSLRALPPDATGPIDELPAPLDRRVRHIQDENNRVLAARSAILAGDGIALGRLMDGSHHSLGRLYEVSTARLDQLVDDCRTAGAWGARLVGAGFGGCVAALVAEARLGAWKARMTAARPGLKIYDC